MISAPIGFNQLRPAMTVNPNGITTSSAVGNPVGATTAMSFTGANYPIIAGTNQPAGGGGFNFGTGNFTMETWIYFTSLPTTNNRFIMEVSYGGPSMALLTTGKIHVAQSFVADIMDSPSAVSANAWHHIAQMRQGNTLYLYIDGIMVVNGGLTGFTYGQTTYQYSFIGNGNGGGYGPWVGYQCESRISNVARYPLANFTRPSAPFVDDANTLLLVHGDSANGSNAISDDNT
jgi:hypothetical protein